MISNKSKNSRWWAIGLIILIIVNISALVTIAANTRFFKKDETSRVERPRYRSDRAGRNFERLFMKPLDLTPEQSERIMSVREETRARMMEMNREMSDSREKLNAALTELQLDLEKIEVLNAEIIRTDTQIRKQIVNMNVEIRKILNPDQLEQYIEMMRKHRPRGAGYGRRGEPSLNSIEPAF